MNKRKVTSKQERNGLVRIFLNSGRVNLFGVRSMTFALPTFYKWLKAYHGTTKEVAFVALKPKQTKTV